MPGAPFSTAAIIGPGLLGGSIAQAARQRMPECALHLWARREAPLAYAREHGMATRTYTDLREAVREADLVILATPISAFTDLAERMLPALKPGGIVTDIGSVKTYVHKTVGAYLTQHGHIFIGSHPMAGAETTGIESARADMLQGATIAITNEHNAPPANVRRLAAFWESLGGRPYEMQAKHHDDAVARISHMPHILAGLAAHNAATGGVPMKDLQRLASSGFRDTTRVCSGPAAMWADILWENSSAVRETLLSCQSSLNQLIHLLETQDKDGVRQWLEEAKRTRETIRQPH